MPITIPGTTQVKLAHLPSAEGARQLLFDVSKNLQGKAGSLKLTNTTVSTRDMAFERKIGKQNDLKFRNTATYVSNLFEAAYRDDIIARSATPEDRATKEQQLDNLIQEFTAHVEGKGFNFGKTTMRDFFNRAEQEFTNDAERLTVVAGRRNQAANAFVARPPAPVAQQDAAETIPEINSHGSLVPQQPSHVAVNPQIEPDIIENLPDLIALPNPLGPSRPVVIPLPLFKATSAPTMDRVIEESTSQQLVNLKKLGAGGMGDVYKIKDAGGNDFILKVEKKDGSRSEESLRKGEVVAVYLNSANGRNIPGFVRPTDLYVMTGTKAPHSSTLTNKNFHHIPLDNLAAAKNHLRELHRNNDVVRVVGSIMPLAKGQSLDKIDLKAPSQAGHRKEIGQQMLRTMGMHNKRGFVDRDYKPANGMYDTATRLYTKIDNGLMVKLSSNPAKNVFASGESGTRIYLAPQKLQGKAYGPEVDLYEGAMGLMEIKYGPDFLRAALERSKGQEFEAYRARHPEQTYLFSLMTWAGRRGHDVKNILAHLKSNDPETKLYERLFEVSLNAKHSTDKSGGRNTVYAEYFKGLDAVLQDPWLAGAGGNASPVAAAPGRPTFPQRAPVAPKLSFAPGVVAVSPRAGSPESSFIIGEEPARFGFAKLTSLIAGADDVVSTHGKLAFEINLLKDAPDATTKLVQGELQRIHSGQTRITDFLADRDNTLKTDCTVEPAPPGETPKFTMESLKGALQPFLTPKTFERLAQAGLPVWQDFLSTLSAPGLDEIQFRVDIRQSGHVTIEGTRTTRPGALRNQGVVGPLDAQQSSVQQRFALDLEFQARPDGTLDLNATLRSLEVKAVLVGLHK